eukprot:2074205-Heterocapsa_arctica.AAC.1
MHLAGGEQSATARYFFTHCPRGVQGLHDRPGGVGSSLGAQFQEGGPSDAAAHCGKRVSAWHGRGVAAANVLPRPRPHRPRQH